MQVLPLNEWFPNQDVNLSLIAGPCSAESEEQVLATARALKAKGLNPIYRAGVWKPRTLPGGFEGHGEIALPWLQKVKEETGFLTSIEVATPEHVELALKAGVDILWIGARTTVNPFSVQAIADALKGSDVPVLVKNPINPDLKLWEGALTRISQAGITKLGAIHRGFSSYKKSTFRNDPRWELAIELKRLHPQIPIICDPSHICGNRDLLGYISQQAIDLNMDGLMLETHINPDQAWTDAAQQVTPEGLQGILDNLKPKRESTEDEKFTSQLEELRGQIDGLDKEIILQLAERMKLVEKIGEYKKNNDVTVLQVNRWDDIITDRLNLGKALNLNEKFVRRMLDLIHAESISLQTEVMNQEKTA